jgi:hypothetical protein
VEDKALFTFTLQSGSKQLVKGLQLLLLLINAVFLFYLLLFADQWDKAAQLTLPFFSLVLFSYTWRNRKITPTDNLSKLLLVLGLSFAINWLANFYWLPGIGMAGITFLFIQALRPITIIFSSDNIQINTFPTRSYSWNEIDQVILRDQILTLNFYNNRFIQHSVLPASNFNVDQFNQFCLHHLRQPN